MATRGVSVGIIPLLGAPAEWTWQTNGGNDYRGESLVVAVGHRSADFRRGRGRGDDDDDRGHHRVHRRRDWRYGRDDDDDEGGEEEKFRRRPVFRANDPAFQQVHHPVQLYGTVGVGHLGQDSGPDGGRRSGAQHERVALWLRQHRLRGGHRRPAKAETVEVEDYDDGGGSDQHGDAVTRISDQRP